MENRPNSSPEAFPDTRFEMLERRSEGLAAKLDSTQGQTSRVREIADKVIGKARKALLRIGQASILLTVLGGINHARTRYEISETKTAAGVTYEHEDRETTEILNYITGRGELPESVKSKLRQELVRSWLVDGGSPIPSNFDSMGLPELAEIAFPHFMDVETKKKYATWSEEKKREYVNNVAESIEDVATPSYKDIPYQYEAFWKLQGYVGAPKIRWMLNDSNPTIRLSIGNEREGFYDPLSNTVFISPVYTKRVLFAEVSHAKQFNEHPVSSYGKLVDSWVRTAVRWAGGHGNLQDSYDVEYRRLGSLEYEAHEEIERDLTKTTMGEIYRQDDNSTRGNWGFMK